MVLQSLILSIKVNLFINPHDFILFQTLHDKAMAGDLDPQIVIFSKSGVPLEFIKLKGQLKDHKVILHSCSSQYLREIARELYQM